MRDNYVKQSTTGAAQCGTDDATLNITQCSTYFGLCDLGLGCPELGSVLISEIESVRGRLGLPVERDLHFRADKPLSAYATAASRFGAIRA